MASLRRQVGFWSSLGRMRLSSFMTVEVLVGLALGIGGSIYLVRTGTEAERISLVSNYMVLGASLLGIVFAALALVVAFFTEDYLSFLEKEGSGVLAFLSPFMVAIGSQIGVLLGSIIYSAIAADVPGGVEHWMFGVLTTLFLVVTLDVLSLARTVMMHGLARAKIQEVVDLKRERAKRGTGG